jgi:hypothetical protein
MRKNTVAGFLALLLGFLLGRAAHQVRHKSPAIMQFEPTVHKLRPGTRSPFTYPDRVV